MKKFFLTLDLEEWYHLDYFKKYQLDKKQKVIPYIKEFLDILDQYNVKITVFVLGELVEDYGDIIKEISDRGHEIACHGYDHDLLYDKTKEQFESEITKAKNKLESLIGKDILGYRASCFTMTDEKIDSLKKIGFKYDSSYINFKEHPLYGSLDISKFNKKEDLVYQQNDFYEFEIPTYSILNYEIPISGGGYFRLFPYLVFKYLFNKYLADNDNFLFYIHPFELSNKSINLPDDVKLSEKFRFSIGRKKNLNKLEKLLKEIKNREMRFLTFSDYLD
jgi:polysaccharide deacetylase family protein (PEP-CTERM system associated)